SFLTLRGLWYSLDSGEMVRDQGTGDIQRMKTARETLGRNQSGPCHHMADSIQTWAAKVLAGDRRAMARAISAVEAGNTLGTELLKRLFAASGKAEVIGITGSPGAGKSTLVEKLAGEYRRTGARVGIVAV